MGEEEDVDGGLWGVGGLRAEVAAFVRVLNELLKELSKSVCVLENKYV